MRQMKKKMIIAIIVTLFLTVGICMLINHFAMKNKEKEIDSLMVNVADAECLAFAQDLKANSIITQKDITKIGIKEVTIPSGAYKGIDGNDVFVDHFIKFIDENGNEKKSITKVEKEELVGRVVKSNVSKNTVILDSLLYEKGKEPARDIRLQEFNFLQLPSDLVENDYIDIRIQFPKGENYSVLIGKKVERIAGENTIFIEMNEEEIMAMGSAIIEAYMQKGVRLYANKYPDPATQLFEEKIVDYVAKYDYAVERLIKEKTEKELRKEIVKLISENESGDKLINEEGVISYTALSGDKIDLEGNVATADTVIKIYTTKEEEEVYINADMLPLISDEIKIKAEENIEEITVNDFEIEDIVNYASIEPEYVEAIKMAKEKNDENIINYYKVMRVTTRDEIKRTYPVKEEVLAVIKNNPNLLADVIAEFDSTALLNTRITEYNKLKAEFEAEFDPYKKDEIKKKMEDLIKTQEENVEKKLKEEIDAQKAERVAYLESLLDNGETEKSE